MAQNMKTVAAVFTTALVVFLIASVMSEMLPSEGSSTPHASATHHRTGKAPSADDEPTRSKRLSATKWSKVSGGEQSAEETPSLISQRALKLQQQLGAIRQREAELNAKEEAMRIIFDEIREEQRSAVVIQQQISKGIASVRSASTRLALREPAVPRAQSLAINQPDENSENTSRKRVAGNPQPLLPMNDSQSVTDAAILVRLLASRGSFRTATSLLRNLKERDAAKVLYVISKTDSQMALKLTDILQTARQGTVDRR